MIEAKAGPSLLLGKLDANTRLVTTENSFVIQENKSGPNEKECWVNKFYYGEIEDAIRGYIRKTLKNPKFASQLDGRLQSLISAIENLEKTVKEVAKNIKEGWDARLLDPVEAFLAKTENKNG